MSDFVWPVRVYYEDTDVGGVVYYANYLKFMERARTEWLRSFGIEQDLLIEQGLVFAVRRVEVDYIHPARFNEALDVTVRLMRKGRASLTFEQTICLQGQPEQLLCRGVVKVGCIDARRFRPTPIPEELVTEFSRVE